MKQSELQKDNNNLSNRTTLMTCRKTIKYLFCQANWETENALVRHLLKQRGKYKWTKALIHQRPLRFQATDRIPIHVKWKNTVISFFFSILCSKVPLSFAGKTVCWYQTVIDLWKEKVLSEKWPLWLTYYYIWYIVNKLCIVIWFVALVHQCVSHILLLKLVQVELW